jgi:Kef-type K+ transport system membrane component KefB
MRLYKIIIYEFLLVFTSVLLFRSLWMIFDRIPWMNQDIGILGSLIVGIIITLISLIRLNKIIHEKKEKSDNHH